MKKKKMSNFKKLFEGALNKMHEKVCISLLNKISDE